MSSFRVIAGLCLLSLPAQGAIAYVANETTGYSATPVAAAYPSAVGAGHLLTATIVLESKTVSVSSISDTRGNVWQRAIRTGLPTTSSGEIWYAENSVAGSDTLTVTLSSGAVNAAVSIGEYSGLALSGSLDQTSGASGVSSGFATTTAANELILGLCFSNAGGYPVAGSGFTRRETFVFNFWQANEDKIVSATGSYDANFTAGGTPYTLMATFHAPTVGGSSFKSLMGVGK